MQTGEEVAIKVQHRNLERMALLDSEGIGVLVRCIRWFFPNLDYTWLAKEFKENLPKELDFLQEAKNAEALAAHFSTSDLVRVPKIYWPYTTRRILTMEYMEGVKITDIEYMKSHHLNTSRVIQTLTKIFSEMMFHHGYVHCDPHPGNVWIRKLNKKNSLGHDFEIILLDHGIYANLNSELRYLYSQLWSSLLEFDEKKIRLYSHALGAGKLYRLFACMLTARTWEHLNSQHERSEDELAEIKEKFSEYFFKINEILKSVPRDLLKILKANDLIRHIGITLNRDSLIGTYSIMAYYCRQTIRDHRLRHSRKNESFFYCSSVWMNLLGLHHSTCLIFSFCFSLF